MKQEKNWLLRILVIMALGSALVIGALEAGNWLVVDELPRKADVIIILAGDLGERTEKGVELWKDGYAPYLMMSGGNVYHTTNIGRLMANHAVELGVPSENIIIEPEAKTTYQNGVNTIALMKEKGFHSAIVVSSEYHMRRVKMVYQGLIRKNELDFVYCAAPAAEFDADQWWKNNQSMMILVSEYLKLLGYAAGREM